MSRRNDIKFHELIMPHFETAYNLARWLMGNDADAADVLQDSSLKALRFMESIKSDHPRAWFLQIVRNTSYTALKSKKLYVDLDESIDLVDPKPSAETLLAENASAQELHHALNQLSVPFREILILRELDEMSYEEIAEILEVPMGTVMSRLARARTLLRTKLTVKGDSV